MATTTTTNHEKQNKKGFISLYKHGGNGNSGNYRPKPEPVAAASKSRSLGWLMKKKANPSEDIKHMFSGGSRASNVERRNNEVKEGIEKEVIVQARKSVSHLETSLASVVAFLQVKVLVSDMPGSMQVHAFRCARRTYDSLEKFSAKHMAYNMKKEFDKAYGPAWHCIVGSSFGSYVTHSTGGFLYFSMEKLHILLFKTKVQRALE